MIKVLPQLGIIKNDNGLKDYISNLLSVAWLEWNNASKIAAKSYSSAVATTPHKVFFVSHISYNRTNHLRVASQRRFRRDGYTISIGSKSTKINLRRPESKEGLQHNHASRSGTLSNRRDVFKTSFSTLKDEIIVEVFGCFYIHYLHISISSFRRDKEKHEIESYRGINCKRNDPTSPCAVWQSRSSPPAEPTFDIQPKCAPSIERPSRDHIMPHSRVSIFLHRPCFVRNLLCAVPKIKSL